MLVDVQRQRTPLREAAQHNHCEVAKILIAAGADPNAKDHVTIPCMPLAAADSVSLQVGGHPSESGSIILHRQSLRSGHG